MGKNARLTASVDRSRRVDQTVVDGEDRGIGRG